jgi:hypothetical protein
MVNMENNLSVRMCGHDDLSQFGEKCNPKNGKNPRNSARKSILMRIFAVF